MTEITSYLLALLVITVAAELVTKLRMLRHLYAARPVVWQNLGEPHFFHLFSDQRKLLGFLYRREDRALGDPTLSRHIVALWGMHAVALAITLAAIASFWIA